MINNPQPIQSGTTPTFPRGGTTGEGEINGYKKEKGANLLVILYYTQKIYLSFKFWNINSITRTIIKFKIVLI